jgi:hypothetical protein
MPRFNFQPPDSLTHSLRTMALPSSSVLRRSSRSSNGNESLQLYRPVGSNEEAVELLDRVPLTNQDIIDFCGSKPLRSPLAVETDENARLRATFHGRRAEIRDISERLKSGGAGIDEDGRLVTVTGPPQPPLLADLPAAPQLFNFNQQDNEQEEERLFVQEQREASESVALTVKQYREHSVPEEDFELILIEPREGANVNLTFRRIRIAVLAVVTAFVCVILQTLPLLQLEESLDPHFDGLMHELLHMRLFYVHAMHCPGLHREGNSQWHERIFQFLFSRQSSTKCDEGVLHIPALHVLLGIYLHSPNEEEVAAVEPFANGINVSWFLPCEPLQDIEATSCCPLSSDSHLDICTESAPKTCFRGVHDNVVTDVEVDNALRMGNSLIVDGGDHFDIHYEISFLEQRIPSILDKLRDILRDQYNLNGIRPVAYRVNTVGPMDGYGVNLYRSPALTLNQTVRIPM